jgi:hypothetical protein
MNLFKQTYTTDLDKIIWIPLIDFKFYCHCISCIFDQLINKIRFHLNSFVFYPILHICFSQFFILDGISAVMNVETLKTAVIVIIGNVIMLLTSY